MKKNKGLFFIVAILLAVTCLFISCSAEVSENAGGGDKLVYATFDNGSKAITPYVTISYDLIDLNQAYWIYTATKNDGGGSTGQGTFAVSSTLEKGLSGTIGPFSVGSWTFSVAGYKTRTTSVPTSTDEYVQITVGGTTYYLSEKVFEGTNASVSLTTGTESAPAPIDITVNLVTDGMGKLVLDKNFKFAWASTGGATELKMNVSGMGTLVAQIPLTKSGEYYTFGSEDLVYNVAAGDYNLDVEISYSLNDVKYVVATVSNLAVKVYSGQTTRIDAAVLEGNFVYATINASLKSSATTTTVVDTAPTTFVTSYTPASVKSGSVSATEVTTVEFPAEALKATSSTVTEEYSVTSYELDVIVTDIDASQESTFVVVEPAQENVVASIDLTLTMIESSTSQPTRSTTVETFENSSVVAVTTYIAKNLTDPVVYYNGVAFTESTTGAAGTYNYEGTSGKLVIYTNHFSEFYVSSKDEAYNATTGTAYAKVKGAVDAAVANQTIKLLKNCISTDEALEFNDSGVTFDLNGKTLTVERTGSTKSIQVTSDVTFKNGAIVGNLPSTNTSSYAAVYVLANGDLTIEDVDITVNSNVNNESHYAVAILASGAKLAVKDGEFNGLVGTNGQYRNNTLSISGGTFNEAVYFPAHGTYTISGGTFNKAVEIKSGFLTVSGGEFNYADDPQVYTPYWNGTTVTGCSLAAVAYNGAMEVTDYGPTPSVTITGGTFAGKIGLARAYSDITYPEINASVTVDLVYLGLESNYWINEASNSFSGGDGTSNNPYQISNARELARLAALINNEVTRDAYKDKNYILTKDIDLSEKCWTPISYYYRKADSSKLFSGSFNGAGHTITGLNNVGLRYYTDVQIGANNTTPTDAIGEYSYGLFGTVYQATITNVVLTDVNIITGMGDPDQTDNKRYLGDSVGALVGCIKGTSDASKNSISNIQVSGTIKGYDGVGGVIGRIYGTNQFATVSGCSCSSATIEAIRRCGGVIGFTGYYPSSNFFSDCSFSGSVKCLGPESDFDNNYQYYTAGLFYSECIENSNNATSLEGFTNNGGTVTVVYSSTVSDNTPYVSGYKLKGGTYNSKPGASYIATGYSTYNTSDGKWIVASSNAFARITLNESGDVYYLTKNTEGPTTTSDWTCLYEDSLFDAGEYTLELLKDCSFEPSYPYSLYTLITFKGPNITFDLCGHILTVQSLSYVFCDDGVQDLKIQNGTVKNVSGYYPYLITTNNYSTENLILEGNIQE